MSDVFPVVVLGGGVAGLATAARLAEAGVRCCVLEASDALGSHSTAQNAAILRTLIASPELTAIGRASARQLLDPPAAFERPLVDPTGVLLTADLDDAPDLERWVAKSSASADGPIEHLTARQAQRLAPHVEHPDHRRFAADAVAALFLPREGVLDIARLVAGFARQARTAACPADVRLGADAVDFERTGDLWTVYLADGRTFAAEQLLIAGGAWAEALGRRLGSALRFAPRRRHLAVTVHSQVKLPPNLPVVWNHSTTGSMFYARPEVPGLLLCACDETLVAPTQSAATERCPRDPAVLEALAQTAARFLPEWADAQVHSWWAGWRTFYAPNAQRFVIGRDPDVPGLSWAAGLGGHGMTASFEVGRLAARALCDAIDDNRPLPACLEGDDYGGAFEPRALLADARQHA